MKPKIDHMNTACCICGSSETYIKPDGKPLWTRHKDSKGIWDNKSYECYNCCYHVDRSKHNDYFVNKMKGKICCICGKVHDQIVGKTKWASHKCDKEYCTGYICIYCNEKINSRLPDSVLSRNSDWRNERLNPSTPAGKGFIGQQIVAKRFGVDDCNIKMDSFHFYVDISKIPGYGYVEVKIASLNVIRAEWVFGTRTDQEYDTLTLLCMDENWPWKNVERGYIIPYKKMKERAKTTITITKNPSRGTWYDRFRTDEKPFNNTYHNMKLENCKILRKNMK